MVANLGCVGVRRSMLDRKCRGGKGKWCCSDGDFVWNASIEEIVLLKLGGCFAVA